jgi:hypothetical protein
LGIQLAPATVGALAYLSVSEGPPDMVVYALIGYGLLQLLLLVRLLPWILEQPVSAGYWGFTFGLTSCRLVAADGAAGRHRACGDDGADRIRCRESDHGGPDAAHAVGARGGKDFAARGRCVSS